MPPVARTTLSLLLLALLLLALLAAEAAAEKRVALLLGNDAYRHTPPWPRLETPGRDVAALEQRLERLGFRIHGGTREGRDLGRAALRPLVERFARDLEDADIGLFFFAGHAAQVGGVNLLVPVDAAFHHPGEAQRETLLLDDIINVLNNSPVAIRIAIVDACRDNALGLDVASGKGLSSIDAVRWPNTLIVFSTSAGDVALDGTGQHSPFAEALIANIDRPATGIGTVLRATFNEVNLATGFRQTPVQFGSLTRDVVLLPATAGGERAAVEAEAERAWAAVDPKGQAGQQHIQRVQGFLRSYPRGARAEAAQAELRRLIGEELVRTAAPVPVVRTLRLLWVDDQNENAFEKRQLVALAASRGVRIEVTDARDTDEALARFAATPFDAIVSDAGRREPGESGTTAYDPAAGYRLLRLVRARNLRVPYFIYSTSNDYRHRARLLAENGQGSTNDPIELFALVLSHVR